MLDINNFTYIETDDSIILKAKQRDEKGFLINITYTKDPKEHEEGMQAIKDFFIREIL